MRISDIKKAIVAAYPSRQPLMVWGPPGVGKSSAAKQAADALRDILSSTSKKKPAANDPKFGFIDLRLPLLEPVDLRGIPYVDKGVAIWSRPGFLPSGGAGLLMLDEIVQATPSMQAAASQLILDRRIGEYELPPGWMVVAAGNRASDRAAVNAMPTHIANRFVHLDAEVNVEAWVAWALQAGVDMRVVAFIKWRAALLHQFDPQNKKLAFPSPRSWEFVSKLLGTFTDLNSPLLSDMIRGAVGDGPVAEFLGFCKMYAKLPDIDTIMLNPKTAALPADVSVLWAIVTGLSQRVNVDNIAKIVAYFNRITDEAGKPEYSIAGMKEISIGDDQRPEGKKIAKTRAFIEWASKHNEVII